MNNTKAIKILTIFASIFFVVAVGISFHMDTAGKAKMKAASQVSVQTLALTCGMAPTCRAALNETLNQTAKPNPRQLKAWLVKSLQHPLVQRELARFGS